MTKHSTLCTSDKWKVKGIPMYFVDFLCHDIFRFLHNEKKENLVSLKNKSSFKTKKESIRTLIKEAVTYKL